MSLNIVKEPILSIENINDITDLYRVCNEQDKTKYVFDLDEDFQKEGDVNTFLLYEDEKLISSLNIFAPTSKEAEIIALTLPSKRKKGCFSQLLEESRKEIERREIASILLVCDSNSVDGKAVLKHKNTAYEYSEFMMRFQKNQDLPFEIKKDIEISAAQLSEKERLAEISHSAFGNTIGEAQEIIEEFFNSSRRDLYSIRLNDEVIGMIGIHDESVRKYIYGFCIDSNYRKQGIGKYVLNEMVHKNLKEDKIIELEVQVENRGALRVYENVGFNIEAEFMYYRNIRA